MGVSLLQLGLLLSWALIAPVPRLQHAVERLMGNRPGAIVLYDLRSRAVVAVAHPETAFAKAYAPGSLMKVVTAAALLESKVASPQDQITCTNHWSLDGRDYTCGFEGGHGRMAMQQALAKSCSIYFYTMAQRLSDASLVRAAHLFGLGCDAGVSYPQAAKGMFRLSSSVRLRTLAAVGEGGMVKMSPWQAVLMMERIATGTDELQPSTLKVLRAALLAATESGTATAARVHGLTVAGKTGTASDASLTHGWFAGYAPAENPRVVVSVFLLSGDGHTAAALAGKVLQCWR